MKGLKHPVPPKGPNTSLFSNGQADVTEKPWVG